MKRTGRRWTWKGWLLPRGKQFTSGTTKTPCLYAFDDDCDIQDIAREVRAGPPVAVRVTITAIRRPAPARRVS